MTDGDGWRSAAGALLALLVAACSEGGGAAESADAGPPTCDDIDWAAYAGGEHVSLKADVMPIFGLSCAVAECHLSTFYVPGWSGPAAALPLGAKCKYDPEARWKCVFPDVPNPDDPRAPQPLDQATVDAVWAALTSPALTVNGGKVLRVVAGYPERSFLMQKLAGTHNDHGYACTNQRPDRSQLPCGDTMPWGGNAMCEGPSRVRFDALARWIAQGAKDD